MKRFLAFVAALAFAGACIAADLGLKDANVLRVAVYKDFAPFHNNGKGIDVEVASLLAQRLGVKLSLMPFDADETMDDDLRNMVWKGHYLGYGPADVMIHVPVDDAFMERNDKVKIFAPYYRESVLVVRNVERIPELDSMRVFENETIGVEDASIGSLALASAEGGKLTRNVRHFKELGEAFKALRNGEVSAVLGMRSQVEAAMGDTKGFAASIPPLAGLPPAGWVLGLSVKTDNVELARALQKAMNELEADGSLDRAFKKFGVQRLKPL
jgi:ABC-type amino acid transport substrate-binding protein